MDAQNPEPRFEPKTRWAALPVQPPSGTWQRRLGRMYPMLVANTVVFFALAVFTHPGSMTWIPVWILLATELSQTGFLIYGATRGGLLEGRERRLGYTTWARKR